MKIYETDWLKGIRSIRQWLVRMARIPFFHSTGEKFTVTDTSEAFTIKVVNNETANKTTNHPPRPESVMT